MTDMQDIVVQAAIAADRSRSRAEFDAATAGMEELDHGVVLLKADEECENVTG
ncbi:hypothetical protein [Streptomyces sp. SJL17-1]|uniref:hypothetical protein n=1 Tax=Streptomyces sp. SJL17-1 TaxID=2967223 RepID=UPI002967446D|nr:hypothetical protein [Streptomyces sp. SJL17-1]